MQKYSGFRLLSELYSLLFIFNTDFRKQVGDQFVSVSYRSYILSYLLYTIYQPYLVY